MTRLLFWILLLGNGVIAIQNYLASNDRSMRNPEKLKNQMQADKLVLIPKVDTQAPAPLPEEPQVAAVAPAPEPAPAVPEPVVAPEPVPAAPPVQKPVAKPATPEKTKPAAPVVVNACYEIGQYTAVEARHVDRMLERLGQPAKRIERQVEEISSYMVHVVVKGGQPAADKQAQQLRRQGITDYYVIPGSYARVDMRWNVSLGVFSTEAAARQFMKGMQAKGVADLKVTPRSAQEKRFFYKLDNVSPAMKERLQKAVRTDKMRTCS